MKRLLILGGSEFQIPLIKRAKKKGYYIGVIDINEDAPGRKFADVSYIASLKDKNMVLEIANQFKPDGITVGMIDIAVPTCAYVASKLNLPGMDELTALCATNKFEMIKAFEAKNVPHPWFFYVSKENIKDKINISFPAIVKPTDMAGSRGIFLVNNEIELKVAMIESSNSSDTGNILIEEYLDGPEVSVELIVKDSIPYVIQITDKTTSGAPHFAEIGHLQPSQLPKETLENISKVACDAAIAIGLKNSLGHAEIKVTPQGPKMVEIGARAGGDGIAEQLIELSTGISFSEVAIQIAMGEEIKFSNKVINKSSCIRFILTQKGILQSIENVEKAKKVTNVEEINITGVIGKYYNDMIDNSGRIGYVISSADKAIDAKKACDTVINMIKVKYKN